MTANFYRNITTVKATKALKEVNGETMWQDAAGNVNYFSLATSALFGDEGDVAEDIFDAAMPNVRESFSDYISSVVEAIVLGLILNAINIGAYAYLFVASKRLREE